MQRVAFYGKGGIGKSTVAAGVSMALALQGKRVLHVGCDPKHDSTLVLVEDGKIKTVLDQIFTRRTGSLQTDHLIMQGKRGIDCVESGGPQAGLGCGGRAVSRMFEVFDQLGLVDAGRYDVTVFDVLGDVVCGGFAAPLRSTFAPKVVIVLSEEMAAAYAANNIANGVKHYLDNGVCLAGVVINLRNNQADLGPVRALVAEMNTRVLAVIRRDPKVGEAEVERQTILEYAPRSKVARTMTGLARELMELEPSDCPVPAPLALDRLRAIMQGKG